MRLNSLRRLLNVKKCIRLLEIHSGLSGLIVENISITNDEGISEFDGMWASSLTSSTTKGKPDNEAVDLTSRLSMLNEVIEVTTKPIIYDADTGGQKEHLVFTIRTLERLGISAAVIEDKTGLKKNSLFENTSDQVHENIDIFCDKISTAKKAQITDDFMVVARIESLILSKGVSDAISRAKAYIDAGADSILIHSKSKDPTEVYEFCDKYNLFKKRKPLIVVPSSYNKTYEEELIDNGANVIIYANHLLRSAYPNMISTALSILENKRSFEADESMLPIKELLELIPDRE